MKHESPSVLPVPPGGQEDGGRERLTLVWYVGPTIPSPQQNKLRILPPGLRPDERLPARLAGAAAPTASFSSTQAEQRSHTCNSATSRFRTSPLVSSSMSASKSRSCTVAGREEKNYDGPPLTDEKSLRLRLQRVLREKYPEVNDEKNVFQCKMNTNTLRM